jgi:hypothetical protein
VFGVGFGTFGNMRNAVTLVALLWEAVRVNGVRSKLPLHGGVAVTGEVIYLGRGRGSESVSILLCLVGFGVCPFYKSK